jgi:acyl-CoA thioesterase
MTFEFDRATALSAISTGRFEAILSDQWCGPTGRPHGGYTQAICVNALSQFMAPEDYPELLLVNSHFHRPASIGGAQVEVTVHSLGRALGIAQAMLWQGGKIVLQTTATFKRLAASGEKQTLFVNQPVLKAPEACADLYEVGVETSATVAGQCDYRYDRLPGWRLGTPSSKPVGILWIRFKDRRPLDKKCLPFLVDAAAPVVFELGARGSSTIELNVQVLRPPDSDWLGCCVTTKHLTGAYHDEDFELWDQQGHLVALARQLAILS